MADNNFSIKQVAGHISTESPDAIAMIQMLLILCVVLQMRATKQGACWELKPEELTVPT